jgi:hypothetical protein
VIQPFETLRHGLVGAWCPSASGGNRPTVDLSHYRRNATLNGSWVAQSDRVGARVNGGSNEFVIPGAVTDLTGNFTVAFWIYLYAYNGSFCCIVDKSAGSSPTRQFSFFINTSGDISFGSIGQVTTGSRSLGLPLGSWQHVAIRRSAPTTMHWMRNAVIRASDTTTTYGNITSTDRWSFGQNTSGGGTLPNAAYDDIRIYNRALTASEMLLLASRPGIGLVPQRQRRFKKLGNQWYINIGGTWKKADAYIKASGEWKQSEGKLNVSGTWK